MAKAETVLENPQYSPTAVNKVNNFTGEDLTTDTYYFQAGQVLQYHKHPNGDQVFFIIKGQGTFYLDNGSEAAIPIKDGSIVYVPKGVWHKITAEGGDLVACQVTRPGAGNETR